MSGRPLPMLGAVIAMGVALAALTRCELLVNLDRSEVAAEGPDGCSICTDLTGGEDSGGETGPADASDGAAESTTMDSAVE